MKILTIISSIASKYARENKDKTNYDFFFAMGFILGLGVGSHYPESFKESELVTTPNIEKLIGEYAKKLGFIKVE